jgi:hypothetical protein
MMWRILPPATLKVEAADSSKMSVPLYQTAWRYIPDDSNTHIYYSKHLTSNALV